MAVRLVCEVTCPCATSKNLKEQFVNMVEEDCEIHRHYIKSRISPFLLWAYHGMTKPQYQMRTSVLNLLFYLEEVGYKDSS